MQHQFLFLTMFSLKLCMTCLVGTVLAGGSGSVDDVAPAFHQQDTPDGLVILQQQVLSKTQNNTVIITMLVV